MSPIEIKSTDGKTLYASKHASTIREAVEEAVREGANLADANLADAYLADANLACANLARAYLAGANLADANLVGANLVGANLAHAYLVGANLAHANLARAYLADANLAHANLARAKGVHPARVDDLRILLDQPAPVRAYKLVRADGEGPFTGGVLYEIGETVSANLNRNEREECGAGINLATLPWCLRNWRPGHRILICEFDPADAVIPHFTDGKFRVAKAKVIREYEFDPVELGLVEEVA